MPDVEVVAVGRPREAPLSVHGPLLPPSALSRAVRLRVGPLVRGLAYAWQARLRTCDGRASPWVAFGGRSGAVAFRIPRLPPPAPVLTSLMYPQPHAWSTTPLATLTWPPAPPLAHIVGYAVRLDRRADGVPGPWVTLRRPRLQVRVPADGRWYVHVRARDASGAWSGVATYPLQVDQHPLALRDVRFPHLAFDPDVEGEPMVATIQGVAWLRLQVYVQGTPQVVRTLEGGLHSGTTTLTWDGRDQQGRLLPGGSYRLVLTATDPFGRQAVADYSDIVLLRRRVVVSLRQQRLVAYAGTQAVASTLVTTGNRRLPTPVGIFHILAVYHPFTMVSPWPPSSPDYYAPVHLRDALLFDERGFFIHDAPWRHRFGPGSNALAGRPGQDRTGTHGCVNVPAAFAAWLARWAAVGTAVVVVP